MCGDMLDEYITKPIEVYVITGAAINSGGETRRSKVG